MVKIYLNGKTLAHAPVTGIEVRQGEIHCTDRKAVNSNDTGKEHSKLNVSEAT